jgi:DNA mismatch repair protein MutS2
VRSCYNGKEFTDRGVVGVEQWALNPLEFHQVREMLKREASSVLGKEKVAQLRPSSSLEEVRQHLQATTEGMDLLRLQGEVPLVGIRPIQASVQRANIGSMLNPMELLDIASTISSGRKVKSLLRQVGEEKAALPILRRLTESIASLEQLEQQMEESIDEQGVIRDRASSRLSKIRQRIHQVQHQINHTLQQILHSPHYAKMVQERIITQRYDRYVIPIKQEYRGAFAGIVHDQSASGATLFVEPQAVVPWNNQLREQELAEQKERERILRELTTQVAAEAEILQHNLELLAEIDFIIAKARFGHQQKAICPMISEEGCMRLKQACHPLIAREVVVPLDVEMGEDHRAMVITGPNTGGKTVVLKTVGLFALMVQSGLPIPVAEGSMMPVYSGIFADIGDEQSIEQNLSTFSSHLTHIIHILHQVDARSLVLFDELGVGTDPSEGAALAIALLQHVINQGCMVIATTHYRELSYFAHIHSETINASVEFDVETLRPTYRLLIGIPGQSHAFAVSHRLGLPEEIIAEARQHISRDEHRLEEIMAMLTRERKKSVEERIEAERLRLATERLYEDVREQRDRWEEEERQIRAKVREEAQQIIFKAKQEAEAMLKQLREWAKAGPQKGKEHLLLEAKKRLEEAVPALELPKQMKSRVSTPQVLEVGDEVIVHSIQQRGIVVKVLTEGEYQVQVGSLKIKVHQHHLEKQTSAKAVVTLQATSTMQRAKDAVPLALDLRGSLVEEAMIELDKYLDDAILAGYQQVSLIHGKGTGALRTGVQKFLRQHRSVKTFRLGSHGEGGTGVTVVELG